MSYPWYQFKVTFRDAHDEELCATGGTVTDAARELLEALWSGNLQHVEGAHGDVMKVEYAGCLTPGVDPEHEVPMPEGDAE